MVLILTESKCKFEFIFLLEYFLLEIFNLHLMNMVFDHIGVTIFQFAVFLITLFVLCFGIYFLLKCSKRMAKNQNVYLINFTMSEIVLTLYHILCAVVMASYPTEKSNKWFVIAQIMHYNTTWLVNLLTLTFLTLDRFAEVYLNITYEVYITRRKTMFIILGIWMLAFSAGISSVHVWIVYNFDILHYSLAYFYPILDLSLFVLGIVIYTYIYIKCIRSKVSTSSSPKEDTEENRTGTATKQRKIFVPVLIMITFTIFVFIPDMVYLLLINVLKITVATRTWLLWLFSVSYSLNMISDVSIYIFMQRGIRTMLLKRWRATGFPLRSYSNGINSCNVSEISRRNTSQ